MRYTPIIGLLIAMGLAETQPAPAVIKEAATGALAGRVTFDGTPPAPIVGEEGGPQPVLHVDRTGGLRYAVVFLPDAPPGDAAPPATATMNQRNFVFLPQVLAVRNGQIVRFTNDDPANHNVRAQDSNPANTFSINTAAGSLDGDTRRFAATRPDRPLELSCDIHPWMAAWVYVFTHDRFAATDADGRFRIDNVATGRHRVAVRQPAGGLARDLAVEVRPDGTARLDVRFTPTDMGMPSR